MGTNGRTDGRTDGRTEVDIEARVRLPQAKKVLFDITDNVFGCNKFVNDVFNSGKMKNSLTLRTLPSLKRTRLSFHYLGGTSKVDAIPTSMKVQ